MAPEDFVSIYNDTSGYPLVSDVAEALGVSIRTARRHAEKIRSTGVELVERGTRRSETGEMGFNPVLPGYAIKKTSTQFGEDGEVQREWIQQTKRPGEEFELPEGQIVKGVSALVDAEGRVMQQWIKTKVDDQTQNAIESLTKTFEAYKGFSVLPPAPVYVDEDLLTVYNIVDHHLGLWSWARRTGQAYNLKIAKTLLLNTMGRLVANAPNAHTAIVLNLGDFFHADDSERRTRRSGNVLDVEGDYMQILQLGVELMIAAVELALQKHQKVKVRNLPGNHDEHAAKALTVAIAAFFANNPRVEVDLDPSEFFWHQFGKVFIAATHGHMVKPEQMPAVMASYKPKIWGNTVHRYAYFGHIHHKSKGGGENHGVTWETFRTLAGKDGWHYASGFASGRSMYSITHHRLLGERTRHTENVA